eukprot:4820667-Ditylum_brightwellii.AAC.1
MLDPNTSIVYNSRDVIWLLRMYYQKKDKHSEIDLQPWPDVIDLDEDNVCLLYTSDAADELDGVDL